MQSQHYVPRPAHLINIALVDVFLLPYSSSDALVNFMLLCMPQVLGVKVFSLVLMQRVDQ